MENNNEDINLEIVRKVCIGMMVIDSILAVIGAIEGEVSTVLTKVGFMLVFLAIYKVTEKIERKEKM